MKKHFALALSFAALLVLALPAQAIYVSNCPQICTPTCPCSIQCLGPFGTTTCGAAGQACTPLTETPEDGLFLSFEQKLAQLETGEANAEEAPAEPTEAEAEQVESTEQSTTEETTTESK